jgi:hypothetical protein
MREHAVLLKEISDYLDGLPDNTDVDPKILATEFAARYDQPSLDRIEGHIIDQMRMRHMWPRS